jgi:hypothetical protein
MELAYRRQSRKISPKKSYLRLLEATSSSGLGRVPGALWWDSHGGKR